MVVAQEGRLGCVVGELQAHELGILLKALCEREAEFFLRHLLVEGGQSGE
jgi:hypothetical protein